MTAFLPEADRRALDYRRFRAAFGNDEVVVASVSSLDDERCTLWIARVHQALEVDPSVEQVLSMQSLLVDGASPRDLLRLPAARGLGLFSRTEGGGCAARAYGLGPLRPSSARARLVAELGRLREHAALEGVVVRAAGNPLLNWELDRAAARVERVNLPVLAGVSALFLWWVTRSLAASLALLPTVGLGVAGTEGLLGWSNMSTNLIVNIAKPLLFVLTLASGIHVWSRWDSLLRTGCRAREAAHRASVECRVPIALALFTTALGFASLMVSELPPVRRFGGLAAVGSLLAIPLTTVLLPVLLGLVPVGVAAASARPVGLLARLAESLVTRSMRAPRLVVGLSLVSLVSGLWLATGLRTDPHAIHYLASDHPLRVDHVALEADGVGLSSVELFLESEEGPVDPAELRALAGDLEALPQVRSVISSVTMGPPGWANSMLREFVSGDGRAQRVSLLVPTLGRDALARLERRARRAFVERFSSGRVSLTLTGNYSLLLEAQANLLSTLAWSLLLGLGLIEGVLLLVLRSPRAALVALLPNVLPVALGFGWMALLDIPIDVGTSMTAAVALGIAVDDTLHLIHAWRPEDVAATARGTGRAIVTSSLVVGAGFAAVIPSPFLPAHHFGLLCAAAMISALLADLLVLPALLHLVGYRR